MNLYRIIFKDYKQGEIIVTNFTGETFDEAYNRFKNWKPNAIITSIIKIK